MFAITAVAVPPADRSALGALLRQARESCQMNRETLGYLLGEVSPEAVYQMERGLRAVPIERVFGMRRHPEGQKFLAAFTHVWAQTCDVQDADGLVAEVKRLYTLGVTRMAKASLQDSADQRRSA